MCEFCVKHGEGKKWYLQAKHYAEDMLSDARRRSFMLDFFSKPEHLSGDLARMESLAKAPAPIRRAISALATRQRKRTHFGQVVPLEDVKEIFGFVNSIVRLPCICRHVTLGREVPYCYGVSMGPGGGEAVGLLRELGDSFFAGPDTSAFEELDTEQALAAMADHEKKGLCHSLWTFMTPYIGGICNCDRADCVAMKSTVTYGVKMMFRAEYVAAVDPDLCKGCRTCMRLCQFGAMAYSVADQKVRVDRVYCYGCGVCRSLCPNDAIKLKPRAADPVAASLW